MRGLIALSLGLGAVGVGALLARASSGSDSATSTGSGRPNEQSAADGADDVFTLDPASTLAPGATGQVTVEPDSAESTTSGGAVAESAPPVTVAATASTPATSSPAPPTTTPPTTIPPTTAPPTTVPPFPADGVCGPATIEIGELIDASTQLHERPIPVVPREWSFALGPTADEGVGNPIDAGSQFMNPWNHIYEGTGTVEMDDVCVAVRQNGVWTVRNFGPMCVAIQTTDFGNWGGPDTGQCDGDLGRYVVEPGVFTHGWPDSGWAEIVGGSGTVQYVLSWGAVRGDGSLYHCGIDRRNRGETGVINPMAHGRAFVLTSEWRACIAHNMNEAQVLELCRAGALPPGFPLVGGCERT